MTKERTKRRLCVIVSADVAGYARLMSRDEDGTLAALQSHRAELIDAAIASHNGRIVKTMGDGLLLEFPSVMDAVRCCVEVQQGMKTRNAGIPDHERIEFRVGINLGDVIAEGDDIFGGGVNVAARLEALADPGGICLSEAVVQQAGPRLGLVTEDMGPRALKNIEAPVRAYRLRGLVDGARPASTSAPAQADRPIPLPPERPALAILPFRSLNPDPDTAFMADGLALGVQTLMVQLSNIFFVNACGHAGYRDGTQTAAEALAAMPVRYAIEGALQRAGSRIRLQVQLTELANGALIWAETYDRGVEDIFALQDEIASEIARALSVKLIGAHVGNDFTGGLKSPAAWEHFLRGVNHMYRWERADNRAAIPHFMSLTEAHPESALGPCYLSVLHYAAAKRGWSNNFKAELAKAERWARRAVRMSEGNNGLGHAVLSALRLDARDHAGSLDLARSGVAYRSGCPFALAQLGTTETYSGDPASGIKHVREALTVRMQHPADTVNALAIAYRDTGETNLSIPVAQEASRLDPDYVEGFVTLCSDFSLDGNTDAARDAAHRILAVDPQFRVTDFLSGQPYNDPAAVDRLHASLVTAGLPD